MERYILNTVREVSYLVFFIPSTPNKKEREDGCCFSLENHTATFAAVESSSADSADRFPIRFDLTVNLEEDRLDSNNEPDF